MTPFSFSAPPFHLAYLSLAAAAACLLGPAAQAQEAQPGRSNETTLPEVRVVGTAEEELKQAPGVSVITAEDIAKRPPANDLSEIIRTQPGVNLTGNSTSGQRGNNRQIDIRGMGPENTLILIDGKPVTSRNSVRYGWRGERDTRGDTNWVPAEEVERIEVIRGPAAARYGNGAAGGVVNIVTKDIATETHGSATVYFNQPQHSEDGASRRLNFNLSGPISDMLSYRLYGNVSKTDSDAYDINAGHTTARTGTYAGTFPAGREGVRNRDLNGRLNLKINPDHLLSLDAGFSRQGNIYAGDTQNTNNFTTTAAGAQAATAQRIRDWLGRETNVMYRENVALTHKGKYDFGTSTSFIQYESTRNSRLNEGLAGGTEGLFSSNDFSTNKLETITAHTEASLPSKLGGLSQMWTVGTEWVGQKLRDQNSMSQTFTEAGTIAGLSGTGRDTDASARIFSVFAENNIGLGDKTILTPGLRFDHHSEVGNNWSPALNLSHAYTETVTFKAGIARAYKAPNLYQTNPNYVLYSRGQGCWGAGGACYLVGNKDLKAETSINKEIGVEYKKDGVLAGLTFFRNDYKNKIDAGLSPIGNAVGGSTAAYANADIFTWENVPKALVQGLEGTFKLPLSRSVEWSNNFTYMTTSKNKTTGERLSIIPKYTINSTLDWQVDERLGLQATATLYGKQHPKKYDYQGNAVTGEAATVLGSYALFGVSANYRISKTWRVAGGVSNLLDKRLYRRGNASGTGDLISNTGGISGAGAATYNEPGRAFYASATASF
ncbi:MAG: Ferric enterobactin receptor [Paracidovorax wautersii]|uniref:Ferric enterobactin receptor n=1 Tax=Paracidovorax wautersii TaxID=1177982 RepID=A0A7V8FLP6_9BURK|nr:MAG: Ferric enterobactin receptor [Paracidovorax wautersii]